MRFTEIVISGFQSFRQPIEVDLTQIRQAAMIGANGTGKSSLANAISWVLTQEKRIPGTADVIVNDFSDAAEVSLSLQSNGKFYNVTRRLPRKGTQTLYVRSWDDDQQSWIELGEQTDVRGKQRIVQDIMGMSSDSFHALSMIEQNGMSRGTRFTGASSERRRSILMDLVPDLAVWSQLEEAARLEYTASRRATEDLEARIHEMEQDLAQSKEMLSTEQNALAEYRSVQALSTARTKSQATLDSLIRRLNSDNEERETTVNRLNALSSMREKSNAEARVEAGEIQQKIDTILQTVSRNAQSQSEATRLDAEAASTAEKLAEVTRSLPGLTEDLEAMRASRERTQATVDKARATLSLAESDRQRHEASHQAMQIQGETDVRECLVCKSELSEERFGSLLAEEQSALHVSVEALALARETLSGEERALGQAASRVSTAERALSKARSEMERLKERQSTFEQRAEEQRAGLVPQQEILAMTERADILDRTREKVLGRIETKPGEEELLLKDTLNGIEAASPDAQEMQNLRKIIEDIDRESSNRSVAEGVVRGIKQEIVRKDGELRKRSRSMVRMRAESEDLKVILEGCRPKGAPSILLGSILSEIQDIQNETLRRLMGDRAMQISFRQEKELKSRNGTEQVLDIMAHMPTGAVRPIESLSGGEHVRITLTNLLAMVEVINARSEYPKIETLFLDEPFSELDEESIPIAGGIIQDCLARGVVQTVVLVSHDPRVTESFPQTIEARWDETTDSSALLIRT